MFGGSLPGLRTAGVAIGNAPAIRLAVSPSGLGHIVLDNVGGMFASAMPVSWDSSRV